MCLEKLVNPPILKVIVICGCTNGFHTIKKNQQNKQTKKAFKSFHLKKWPKTKGKFFCLGQFCLAIQRREEETLKYCTQIFQKLTLSRTSLRAIPQHKDCRLGNFQSMYLSCPALRKRQISILFLQAVLAAAPFPHLGAFQLPQTFPHHHSQICELWETDVLKAFCS